MKTSIAIMLAIVLTGCGGGGGGPGWAIPAGGIMPANTWQNTYGPITRDYQQRMNQIYGPGTMGNPIYVQPVPRYW
jgi:hypothetical protein